MKYLVIIIPLLIMTAVGIGMYMVFGVDWTDSATVSANVEGYFFAVPFVVAGIIILITAAAVAPMFMGFVRDVQVRKRLQQGGVRAKGLIMNVRDTGASINNNPVVKLDVQIRPGMNTVIQKTVSRVAVPREGDEIEVLYNPANPADSVEA